MIFHADIQLDRTAAPFWPRHRTTKVALIKAPKYKANRATGEVRLENRNRDGLGNKTNIRKTVKLTVFSKAITKERNYIRAPVQIHIQAGS